MADGSIGASPTSSKDRWGVLVPWGAHFYPWMLGCGVATMIFFAALTFLGWDALSGERPAFERLATFVEVVVFVWTFAAVAWGFRQARGRQRIGWGLLTAAFLLVLLAFALWIPFAVQAGSFEYDPAHFTAAEFVILVGMYATALPLVGAGIIYLSPVKLRIGSIAQTVLDGLIIAGSLFSVSWATLLAPIFAAAQGTVVDRAFSVAAPLFDVVLVTMAFTIASRAPGLGRGPLRFILAGFVAFAIGDAGFSLLSLRGAYYAGHPVDVAYVAGTLAIGLAAMKPVAVAAAAPAGAPMTRPSLVGNLLPLAPLCVGVVAATLYMARDGALDPILVWTGLATIACVVVRLALTLIENSGMASHLDEVARYKGDLLRFVSHEMANPIVPIQLQLAVLKTASADSAAPIQPKTLSILERNVNRLHGLATEVLTLSRLDAGQLPMDLRPADVVSLVASCLESYQAVADQGGVRLSAEAEPTVVQADPNRIGQVVDNLVSNALKFTPPGGAVDVKVWNEGGTAFIAVRDTGVGLSPAQLDGLFAPFGRVHGKTQSPGNGLGLYFSRAIVEAHGGRLWAESDGPGCGARFVVSLPHAPHVDG